MLGPHGGSLSGSQAGHELDALAPMDVAQRLAGDRPYQPVGFEERTLARDARAEHMAVRFSEVDPSEAFSTKPGRSGAELCGGSVIRPTAAPH